MPGRDGTGPSGQGPMTGRQMGLCNSKASVKQSGGLGLGLGRGLGRGLNCGRGMGRGFYRFDDVTNDDESQKAILKQRKRLLEAQLENINQSLNSPSNN